MVVENEDKPWKKKGQLSIPMETVEKWEYLDEALKRWLKEELWFDLDKEKWLYDLVFSERNVPFLVKTDKDLILVRLYMYNLCVEDELSNRLSKFKNWEIKEVKQIPFGDIFSWKLKNLRPGVKEALFGFSGHVPVIKDGEYVNFLESDYNF
jgi:8-oxo-dGTP pyrophosphatase MutT (NUDIX family)